MALGEIEEAVNRPPPKAAAPPKGGTKAKAISDR
jgi:hypothetical protein